MNTSSLHCTLVLFPCSCISLPKSQVTVYIIVCPDSYNIWSEDCSNLMKGIKGEIYDSVNINIATKNICAKDIVR